MQWRWLNVDAMTLPFVALYPLSCLKARFLPAKGSSGHHLFISAFMPTSKLIRRDVYSSKLWCIVGQGMFALWEINHMERERPSYLEWQLNVDATTLPFAALYPLQRLKACFPLAKESSGHRLFISAFMPTSKSLKARFPPAKGSSGHRLFISTFMPTSKLICDNMHSSKSLCIIGQGMFTLREINQMEREMCSYLEWQLNVNAATLPFAALYPLQRLKAYFPLVKRSSGHRLFISTLMCSYLERQLNVDLTTLRDFRTRIQHDFTGPGPYPPMVLPQPFDNFTALCERGRRFSCPVAGK
jgi:hypothetical protein